MKLDSPRAAGRYAALLLMVVGLAACSEELPTDYTAAHREAFLAACSRPLDDPRLLSDICGCVYDRIEDEVGFDEFESMSRRLAQSSSTVTSDANGDSGESTSAVSVVRASLPKEISGLVADCFTTEADL